MRSGLTLLIVTFVLASAPFTNAQTRGVPEDFTAVAIANNNLASGAGTVLISVDRWSTDAERDRLVAVLREKGPRALLDALQDIRSVGRIRTPDSLGYDLHYAYQTPAEVPSITRSPSSRCESLRTAGGRGRCPLPRKSVHTATSSTWRTSRARLSC